MLEPQSLVLPLAAGGFVVADPAARWALSLTDSTTNIASATELHVRRLAAVTGGPAPLRFTLHTPLGSFYQSSELRDGIEYLLGALAPRGRVQLLVHAVAPPPDWHPLALWFNDMAARQAPGAVQFAIECPFDLIPEPDLELLHNVDCQLGFLAGWPAGGSWSPERLRQLSRFGFRIPLVCYVDAENIASVPEWLDTACEANEHSGFSLPLVFCHPAYTFAPAQPAPPAAAAYAALVATVYRKFPDYDDTFQPVTGLIESVALGGWCRVRSTPTDLHLSLEPNGVGLFRQIPARSRPWSKWETILGNDPALLGPDLVAAAARLFAWEGNQFCRGCELRFVCGGIDAWHSEPPVPHSALSTGCEYRKLFLPEFLAEKGQWTAETVEYL